MLQVLASKGFKHHPRHTHPTPAGRLPNRVNQMRRLLALLGQADGDISSRLNEGILPGFRRKPLCFLAFLDLFVLLVTIKSLKHGADAGRRKR